MIDALRQWWYYRVHRPQDRTPRDVREQRERLIRSLNGELDADLGELRASLDAEAWLGEHADHRHERDRSR